MNSSALTACPHPVLHQGRANSMGMTTLFQHLALDDPACRQSPSYFPLRRRLLECVVRVVLRHHGALDILLCW